MPKFVANVDPVKTDAYIQDFVRPVQTTSPLELAGAAIDIASKGYEVVKKAELREELQEQSDAYINEEGMRQAAGAAELEAMLREQTAGLLDLDEERAAVSQERMSSDEFDELTTLSSQEVELIADARATTNKYWKAYQQKRISPEAFKANVEKTLKTFINRAPGLATEFRQVASGVLGFDPTGFALKHALAADETTATTSAAQETAMYNQMRNDMPWLAPHGMDQSQALALNWPKYMRNKEAKYVSDTLFQQFSQGKDIDEHTHKQYANSAVGGWVADSQKVIDTMLGGKSQTLTQADIDNMTPERRAQLIADLEKAKAQTSARVRGTYTQLEGGWLDTTFSPAMAVYDNTIAMLKGERTLNAFTTSNKTSIEMAKNNILATPINRQMAALLEFWPKGTPMPPSILMNTSKWYSDMFNMLNTRNGSVSPDQLATESNQNLTEEEIKERQNLVRTRVLNSWKGIKESGVDITDPSYRNLLDIMKGYTSGVWTDPNTIQMKSMDIVFDMAKDVEFIDVLKNNPDPRLEEQMAVAGANYLKRTFAALDAEIDNARFNPKFVQLTINDNGEMRFAVNPDTPIEEHYGTKFGIEGNIVSPTVIRNVKNLNDTFADRFNNIVKASAHLTKSTNYSEVALKLFGSDLSQRLSAGTIVLDEALLKKLNIEQ